MISNKSGHNIHHPQSSELGIKLNRPKSAIGYNKLYYKPILHQQTPSIHTIRTVCNKYKQNIEQYNRIINDHIMNDNHMKIFDDSILTNSNRMKQIQLQQMKQNKILSKQQKSQLKDREQLYEDNNQLQREKNELEQIVRNQKKQIVLYQEDIESFRKNSNKQLQVQMNRNVEQKEEQIGILKKDNKYLQMKELEIQNQEYDNEINRLSQKLNQQLIRTPVQDEQQIINSIIKNKNQIMQKYRSDIAQLEEKSEQIESELEQTIKVQQIYDNRLNEQDIMIERQEKQVDNMKRNIIMLEEQKRQLISKSQMPSQEQKKIEVLEKNEIKLNQILQQKQETIISQDKKITEFNQQIFESKQSYDRQWKRDQEELNNLNASIQMVQKELIDLKNNKIDDSTDYQKYYKENRLELNQGKQEKEDDSMDIDGNSENAYSKLLENEKKVKTQIHNKRVTFENVKNMGYEINLRFRTKNLDIKELDNYLFEPYGINKQQLSIKDLIDILQNNKFGLSYENAQTLGRYLVEDNKEDKIVFDEERMRQKEVIKSLFKKVIGNYRMLNQTEDEQTYKIIRDIMLDHQDTLLEGFRLYNNDKPYVSPAMLQNVFRFQGIMISNQQIDYLVFKLFEYSNDITKLDYNLIPQIFNND